MECVAKTLRAFAQLDVTDVTPKTRDAFQFPLGAGDSGRHGDRSLPHHVEPDRNHRGDHQPTVTTVFRPAGSGGRRLGPQLQDTNLLPTCRPTKPHEGPKTAMRCAPRRSVFFSPRVLPHAPNAYRPSEGSFLRPRVCAVQLIISAGRPDEPASPEEGCHSITFFWVLRRIHLGKYAEQT